MLSIKCMSKDNKIKIDNIENSNKKIYRFKHGRKDFLKKYHKGCKKLKEAWEIFRKNTNLCGK